MRFSFHLVLCIDELSFMTSENILSGLHPPEGVHTSVHLGGQWKRLGFQNMKSQAALSSSECASSQGSLS